MGKLAIFLVVVAVSVQIDSAPLSTLKLKFKVSGRDLADKDDVGLSDPYLELFYTEEGRKEEKKIGATAVLLDTLNPDWGETFEFEFVRSKKQRFILRLYDDDPLSDDNLGHAYVEVQDFVDKDQQLTVNLNKQGYVIVQTVIPVVTPAPDKPLVTPAPTPSAIKNVASINSLPKNATFAQVVQGKGPTGLATYDTSKPLKLKLKLSAQNLLNKDTVGESDPFVELSYSEKGSYKQTKFGTSKVIDDNPNPVWPETFEFDYDPAKSQKWYFDVKDSDFGDSDGLGRAELNVQEYVSKGQKITINLSKQQGTLTIQALIPSTPVQQNASGSAKNVYEPPPTIIPSARPTKATPQPAKAPTPPPIKKLRFQLSARGLEDRDVVSTSDPYVKVYYQEGSNKEVFIKNTQKFQNKEDADWPDIFEYNYDPTKTSKLRFLVLDEDDNARDDELGNVSVDVADYVKSNENITLKLTKGTLTISKY